MCYRARKCLGNEPPRGFYPPGLGVTIPFGMSPIATNILACRQIVLCLFAIALHPNADRAKASAGGI